MHIQVLHRKVLPGGKSLITIYPDVLGFGTCLIITAGIILLMLPMAMAWNYLKTKYEYIGRIAVITKIAAGSVIFILI